MCVCVCLCVYLNMSVKRLSAYSLSVSNFSPSNRFYFPPEETLFLRWVGGLIRWASQVPILPDSPVGEVTLDAPGQWLGPLPSCMDPQ